MCQSPEASGGDCENQDDQHKAGDELRHMKMILHDTADRVRLDEITADDLDDHEDGTEGREDRGVEAVPNVVHRTSCVVSIFILHAVEKTEDDFAVFRGHTDESRHPHPEDRAETAGEHRSGDTDDVSTADAGRDRGAECLERGDGAVVTAFSGCLFLLPWLQQRLPHDVWEAPDLDETAEHSVEQADAEEDDQKPVPPDDTIDTI